MDVFGLHLGELDASGSLFCRIDYVIDQFMKETLMLDNVK